MKKIFATVVLCLGATAAHASEKFLCYGDMGNYVVLTEGVNEPPAALIACWKGGYACDAEIALQEDTDDDSGVRRFVSTKAEHPEYWLELNFKSHQSPKASITMTLERDGEVLESSASCEEL